MKIIPRPTPGGTDGYPENWSTISKRVKDNADWRCIRCGHQAEAPGPHKRKPCDGACDIERHPEARDLPERAKEARIEIAEHGEYLWPIQRQRVLTVHHFDGDKMNCEWWNLMALCQVCHLSVQGRVNTAQIFMFDHSEWIRPYVAALYAATRDVYLSQSQARDEAQEWIRKGPSPSVQAALEAPRDNDGGE